MYAWTCIYASQTHSIYAFHMQGRIGILITLWTHHKQIVWAIFKCTSFIILSAMLKGFLQANTTLETLFTKQTWSVCLQLVLYLSSFRVDIGCKVWSSVHSQIMCLWIHMLHNKYIMLCNMHTITATNTILSKTWWFIWCKFVIQIKLSLYHGLCL